MRVKTWWTGWILWWTVWMSQKYFEYACFDPFCFVIRQQNMFLHSDWSVQNYMKMQGHWIVQRTGSRRLQVHVAEVASRDLRLRLVTNAWWTETAVATRKQHVMSRNQGCESETLVATRNQCMVSRNRGCESESLGCDSQSPLSRLGYYWAKWLVVLSVNWTAM